MERNVTRVQNLAIAVAALCLSGPVLAQYGEPPKEDRPSSAVAESWLGRSSAELLVQWPVDSGFEQAEDEATGETLYTYHFGRSAYSYDEPIMSEDYIIGVEREGSVDVPIYQNHVVGYNRIDVPYQHHCTITFAANADGVVHRYAYTGVACRGHVKKWGRPKATRRK